MIEPSYVDVRMRELLGAEQHSDLQTALMLLGLMLATLLIEHALNWRRTRRIDFKAPAPEASTSPA